jgi:hypothetical protein
VSVGGNMRRHSLIMASLALVAGCSLPAASQTGASGTATSGGTSAATTDTSDGGGTAAGDSIGPSSDTVDPSTDTVDPSTDTDDPSTDTDGTPQSEGPVVTGTLGVEQELHQPNFFSSEGWAERNTRVPLVGPVFGMVQQLQPLGSACPTEQDGDEFPVSTSPLELRLDGKPGTLKMTVGQTTNSRDSDVLLDAKLLVDDAPSKTATLKYNQTNTLSTPVAGVSVVKLIFSVDVTSKTCTAEAVAYNITIRGG